MKIKNIASAVVFLFLVSAIRLGDKPLYGTAKMEADALTAVEEDLRARNLEERPAAFQQPRR